MFDRFHFKSNSCYLSIEVDLSRLSWLYLDNANRTEKDFNFGFSHVDRQARNENTVFHDDTIIASGTAATTATSSL